MWKNKVICIGPFLLLLGFAQRPLNCSLLPMNNNRLKSKLMNHGVNDKIPLERSHEIQADFYNRHASDLSTLNEGDLVRMRSYKKGDYIWEKTVISQTIIRNFNI